VASGQDYTKQEAFSTHIQDIAVRNVLRRLGVQFTGKNGKLLQIRSSDSEGFKYGPGNIPFAWPHLIQQPSLCPKWANQGSVEDLWQSNKMLQILG
jgi:NAD dependent epimerase/dehydratase family enzyme